MSNDASSNFTHRKSSRDYDVPPGLCIIQPPSASYHRPTGLSEHASIVLPETLQKHAPNKHLAHAINFIQNGRYTQAARELQTIKEFSSGDIDILTTLKQALDEALATSDDQQEDIWKTTDLLGLENLCFLLIHEPLKTLLSAPPNTELALCCSTTYLVYTCWRHAQRKRHLDTLETYLSNVSVVPPLYTIMLPPPLLVMEHPTSGTIQTPPSKTHLPLERTEKSAYDGCRTRDRHEK
jgi:hypothetical protein